MKYKELKKLLKKTQLELFRCQGRLHIANKCANDMIEFSNQQERIQIMSDKEVDRRGVIIDYLEDYNRKLIRAGD